MPGVRLLSPRWEGRRIRMLAKGFESSVEHGGGRNTWLWLTFVFLAAPLFWLLLGYWFGEQISFGWLAVAAAYIIALLVGANYNPPVKKESHRRLEVSRLLARWLGPLFWGGILVTPYLLAYGYLFDRENFFPR
jgi:hypothetical protein